MREPAASQIIAGKYRLESLIGHGGMGSVWRAQHVTLGMPVAVKFMGEHAMSDPESRKRFDREARALASLRTPHIVQVLDHGVDDDTPYIVMELLEGEDLSSRLQRERRLSLTDASFVLAQSARALRRAHEAGVTHRDLKPSNIFLARIDDETVVKVLDFGVAKLAAAGALDASQLTRTGTLLGSPGYMSPEQARGKEVDSRSDLWALAVILFRCITGVKPFAGDSIAELVIKLCIDPRPVATHLAPDLPPSVDRFFDKAFATTPDDRYQTAVEMASAFAQLIGQPGLELSRTGPSPVAGVSRAVLDQPAPHFVPSASTPSSAQPPGAPGASPLPLPSGAPAFAMPPAPAPATSASPALSPPAPPHSPLPVFGSLPRPLPPPNLPAHREPTPTPASFAGFSPSGLETASAPPSADPSATPLPTGALGSPPMGALAAAARDVRRSPPHGPDAATPSGAMSRVPTPPPASRAEGSSAEPTMLLAPDGTAPAPDPRGPARTPPASSPSNGPRPSGAARPPFDPKVLLFAVAGAAVLAIFFFMAISGLRRRHTNAGRPLEDDDRGVASRPFPTQPTADPASPEPTASASASAADPAATGTADPAPTADPSATASAEPAPGDPPQGGPTVVEAPVAAEEPSAAATASTATAPRTGATSRPATSTGTKTSPTPSSSAKKKGPKPNFGY